MSIWKRASLYLTRRKGKSLILLAILTVIATLVLLCLAVGNAANTSVDNLRKTMGGYFKISSNTEKGYLNNVSDKLVSDVMAAGGIREFNGMDITYLLTDDLDLEPGRFTAQGDKKAKLARFLGNRDSSRNEYFVLRYFSLLEGRHIGPEDRGKALISKELAERNNLSVGDTFLARLDDGQMGEEQKAKVTSHTLEVAGIYQIDASQITATADTAECDREENFIFTDTGFIREVYEELMERSYDVYSDGAAFFVENPKELDEIIENLSELDEYTWDEYVIAKNNKTYEDSAGPLERLSGLVALMVAVILVISVVMLSLILFLWMRERVYEIGVYLSIGIRKGGIMRQHILENLMVACLAFFVAWGTASLASGGVEKALGGIVAEEDEGEEAWGEERAGGTNQENTAPLVEVRIGGAELAEVAGIGILVIILTTGISSVVVLRMRPKDILSTMS